MFVFIFCVFIVLVVKHLLHCLIVQVRDELRIKLFLDAIDKRLILEQVSFGQKVCFLKFLDDLHPL